jgi:predicted SAM-dependent methyltransferase
MLALSRERVKSRIHVVKGDYLEWSPNQRSESCDAIISSEFLSEIDLEEMKRFISECYRMLKPNGITIHSFLSPIPRSRSQRLLIEADSNPRWTKFPPREWFSPRQELVLNQLKQAGFRKIRAMNTKKQLIIKAEAARLLLKNWGVRNTFWKAYKNLLVSEGLEIPDWAISSGTKPG